jgi:hypothetical protein
VKKEFIVERNGRSFVLYAGLLDLAHERGLKSITTTLVQLPSEANGMIAVCHATVETEQGTFTGLGDASPENVSRMMLPHLIRMAETRAKARALRDAVNVGVTALEELGELEDGEEQNERAERAQHEQRDGRAQPGPGRRSGLARRGLRPLEPDDVAAPDSDEQEPFAHGADGEGADGVDGARVPGPGRVGAVQGSAQRQSTHGGPGGHSGPNGSVSGSVRPGAAPATPKQLQTIARMARAAGKTINVEGLSRAQASEIISSLIGEMDQLRAS